MPRSDKPFHIGLTAAQVTQAAVELTRETHLMSWSIRDLAARLGVSASVIYHHIGGKDLLSRAVAERVIGSLIVPPVDGAQWRGWFTELLYAQGPRIAEYPGVAKWMLMHGPTIPTALPILEGGMTLLQRAGFGDRASYAYALLLNTATMTISVADDRLAHEGDGPRDHAAMMTEFARVTRDSEAARAMGEEFIGAFAAGGDAAAAIRWEYYRFAIDTAIAGLATLLDTGAREGNDA